MNKRAFTLTEVLIVTVIIAILSGISAITYTKVVDRSRRAEAIQVLGDIRSAIMAYYYENGENVPDYSALTFDDLYLENDVATGKYFTFAPGGNDYGSDPTLATATSTYKETGENYNILITKGGDTRIEEP